MKRLNLCIFFLSFFFLISKIKFGFENISRKQIINKAKKLWE